MGSEDGRYFITDVKSGRKFLVEPIGDPHITWGDVNPATKKIEGDYGEKYKGCIDEKDTVITGKNGFKNIKVGKIGESPMDIIAQICAPDFTGK